jgi:H+/Cl- antiporter ClcA
VERLRALGEGVVLGALAGVLCGAASAAFLLLLERATAIRVVDERWVYALPLAGLVLGVAWEQLGASTLRGNNLVIDAIADGGAPLPLRMAPMVLVGTVAAHLFGASVGREGTAVQMGASLSDGLAQALGLSPRARRSLLVAGVAGGFGSVFGTPFAGAVFALEFVVRGKVEVLAAVPALVAAVVGDFTTRQLGVTHTAYPTVAALEVSPVLLLKWAAFAVAIAALAVSFITLTHGLKDVSSARVKRLGVRMALGGVATVLLWKLSGSGDFLGLSVPTLVRSFTDAQLPAGTFALKLLFTVVCLGAGFPGGEVTPLFVIGAAAGNLLARTLGLPLELGAGVGMAALFAAASSTPIALSLMAVELLGAHALPHVALVAVLAWSLVGSRSIYTAQRG